MAKPVPLEASGSIAQQRMVVVLVPRDVPILGPAVAGEAEEAPALVRVDDRRGRAEGVVGAADGGLRPACSRETGGDNRHRDEGEGDDDGASCGGAESDLSPREVEPGWDERRRDAE